MNKYEYLLFDFDGTIADNSEGVCKSFAYALSKYGITVENLDDLIPVMGPPLKDSFMELYGFDEEKAEEAVQKYRERYAVKGLMEYHIYDGIDELFTKLRQSGYKLVLATCKPENFARKILDDASLTHHFHFIAGADMQGNISHKEDVLNYIVNSLNISDVSKCLMIGDRKFDLIGAKEFGMDALGVLYGFGDLNELSSYPSIGIAKTVGDISNMLN